MAKIGGKLFLISLVIVLFSCKKLDEKPFSTVEPGDFYSESSQIEAAFAASLNSLWDSWSGYGYGMGAFVHDDQYYGGDLVIGSNHGSNLWRVHYNAILNLNAAIRSINKEKLPEVSDSDIDVLMGQGKFLRGFNYFMLVRMFGGVPLIVEDTPDPVSNPVKRSSIAEVYDLIIRDFKEAAQKLPRKWDEDRKGRPTSGAAKGFLAKAYLTMATYPLNESSNYQLAAQYAKEVIDENDYQLVQNVHEVFAMDKKYGPEMMWSFNSNYADRNTDAQIYMPGILGGWGDWRVQPEWERDYPEQPRKEAYLLYKIDGVRYENWDRDNYPYIKKFLYDSREDFDSYKAVMNFPLMRFADVLLIYAEAANMVNEGPTSEAVDAVNQVINRANGNVNNPDHPVLTTGMSRDAFDEAVINERNLELCFEFDRWFDLVRKRILKDKSIPTIQQNFTEEDYLFPIPDNDLLLDPDLEQNPGYSRP